MEQLEYNRNMLLTDDNYENSDDNQREKELQSVITCIGKLTQYIKFRINVCTFNNALTMAKSEKKLLLLYLHNSNDKFSRHFLNAVQLPQVTEIIKRSYVMLCWNIEDTSYHGALTKTLHQHGCATPIISLVEQKTGTALCLFGDPGNVTVVTYIRGIVSENDVMYSLRASADVLVDEVTTGAPSAVSETDAEEETVDDVIDSKAFLTLMAEYLCGRDYDAYEHTEHDSLRDKIGYALKGPPLSTDGYDDADKKIIEKLYRVILESSNEFCKDHDKVEMAVVYNCTEPLPKEKLKKAKQMGDSYNPITDILPVPVFVLRKCRDCENPCRTIVDHIGRVYDSWTGYLNRNKLHKCVMVVPSDGRFQFGKDGKLLIDKMLSPACDIGAKVLQVTDVAGSVGGFVSTGVAVGAVVPAITVAPVVATAGVVVGVGAGLYAIGRSIHSLVDRALHKESINVLNSESRGAYFNILCGALGFSGAGATAALSQLASKGYNIGKGAKCAVDVIQIINMGVSAAATANSGFEVVSDWINENRRPSLIAIVQLSSSVLFFAHAACNFKSASMIVEESQMKFLKDYQASLRSNRHRKTFTKLLKGTISQVGDVTQGRAEVISTLRNVMNKDDVFAVLTRSKQALNRNGVKVTAQDGQIRLNGNEINMDAFINMDKGNVETFLSSLPEATKSVITGAQDALSLKKTVSKVFSSIEGRNPCDLTYVLNLTSQILQFCSMGVRQFVIKALTEVMDATSDSLKNMIAQILPKNKYVELLRMTLQFFVTKSQELETQYVQWKKTGDEAYYNAIFKYVDVNKATRLVQLFEHVVTSCFGTTQMHRETLQELSGFLVSWVTRMYCDYQETKERQRERMIHNARHPKVKVDCRTCGGHFFSKL